jgi:hypothetical protein
MNGSVQGRARSATTSAPLLNTRINYLAEPIVRFCCIDSASDVVLLQAAQADVLVQILQLKLSNEGSGGIPKQRQ